MNGRRKGREFGLDSSGPLVDTTGLVKKVLRRGVCNGVF